MLLDWLLPIWTLPPVCEIRDKMQVVCEELTHDWAKSTILFVEKVKTRENCVENLLSVVLRVKFPHSPILHYAFSSHVG